MKLLFLQLHQVIQERQLLLDLLMFRVQVLSYFIQKTVSAQFRSSRCLHRKDKNTHVVGIEGNFDDAQTGVKRIFNDKALAEKMNQNGYQFSSANSINIGRLSSTGCLLFLCICKTLLKNGKIKSGDKVNFVVPTGNFGNILAAYYAKEYGTSC